MYSNPSSRRPSPPRSSVPLSRSRTSAAMPSHSTGSSSQRYMARSPFVDGDIYTPSSVSSRRRVSPSASKEMFDGLPLHLSSRLNDSKDYLKSSARVPSPYRASSASGHYEPKSAYASAYTSSHAPRSSDIGLGGSNVSNGVTSTLEPYVRDFETVYRSSPSPTFNKYKSSTLNPRDYSSSSYRSENRDTGHDSTRYSPIPGYRPSTEFRRSPLEVTSSSRRSNSPISPSYRDARVDYWPSSVSRSRSPVGYTSAHAQTTPMSASSTVPPSPTPESEYRSLASRVFSSDYKPDGNLLDLDLSSKALIAESEKTNRNLGLTVNLSAKMLQDMDQKMTEIESRRKKRENSKTPDKTLDSDAKHSDIGGKSPSLLSPEYKDRVDRESRSRERTPILCSDINIPNISGKVDENANILNERTPNISGRSAREEQKRGEDAKRKESVFEVEIGNERQLLDAVKRKNINNSDSKDDNCSDAKRGVHDNNFSVGNEMKANVKCEETPNQASGNRKNSNEQGIESRTESVNPVGSSSRAFNCCPVSFADAPAPSSFDESRRWSISKKVSFVFYETVP